MSNISKNMNNKKDNAENNSQTKKYKGWTNDGSINAETNERGLSSTELLFKWLEVPENLVAWKDTGVGNKQSANGESRSAVLGRIIKYFQDNGIHHRTKHQVATRISQLKLKYTNACRWLAQTEQGIRDKIFVMDDAVENKKVQDKTIHDYIKKICPDFNRLDNIWGTSVSINPPCESSDTDDVEEIMLGQELPQPVEEESIAVERVAAQSRKRAMSPELLAQLFERQDERAQKRFKIDEERLSTEISMVSSMQTIAGAIKAMADNEAAKTELSRLKDQRQALKELYQEGALTLEQYRNHVLKTLGM
ncbi:hypothetical protein BD560DRAFT_444116 [Blakeslea trispora]|nr:hypothetical protein BD560DRAFT_444116 [Blakeslea trispora]